MPPGTTSTRLCLPHPYLTAYDIKSINTASSEPRWLEMIPGEASSVTVGEPLPTPLHSKIRFTLPEDDLNSEQPATSNNTFWARIRRSPQALFRWTDKDSATIGQLWLIIYALFTLRPENEYFRLVMNGPGGKRLAEELKAVALAVEHPTAEVDVDVSDRDSEELIVIRSTFWQGAGSPFGARAAWVPDATIVGTVQRPLSAFPLPPLDYTVSTKFPTSRMHSFHPRRPQKPTPGAVIYRRYIPHLSENFNIGALDYNNQEHLELFHKWQNDPRVSAGWNETGTLDQHREYLRKLHEDPHTLTMLARFDDVFFAYYEVYWAKVSTHTATRINIFGH